VRGSRSASAASGILALVSTLACAGLPPASVLDGVERVFVVSAGPPSTRDLRARGRGESALRGAGSGTAEALGSCGNAGGGGDFAVVGLVLCLGLAGIIGGLGGGVLGAMEGLPPDAVRELNVAIEERLGQEDLEGGFLRMLSERIPPPRRASSDDPDLVLRVRIRELRLEQHGGQELSLSLAAAVQLDFPRLASGKRRYERSYRYAAERQPIERWLAGDGAGVSERLRDAFAGLADEIVDDLWGP